MLLSLKGYSQIIVIIEGIVVVTYPSPLRMF